MRHLTVIVLLGTVLTTFILRAEEEKAVSIPFWERPDYVLETPDVIEIKVISDIIPTEVLEMLDGSHLIGPDGHIDVKFDRLRVQDQTIVQCENTVFEWLAKRFDTNSLTVRVKVFSCNSKEFHIVYVSEQGGEQRLSFPFTGHETVTKAIECCNGLAPGASPKFLLLRAPKVGKPVEMTPVHYNEAFDDPKKNLALRSGDTILIRQDFKGEDLRPDGPITTMTEPFGTEPDKMLVSEDDYEIPAFELDEPKTKTASQIVVPPQTVKQADKRIARTVFFNGDAFGMADNLLYLSPLMKNIEPESSVSCMIQAGKNGGLWLILYGNEETVTELHTVFEEIARGK